MGRPSFPPQKGAEPPNFRPFLLWPNGWMHQVATWYGGRPQPGRLCVRWEPSPLPKKAQPQIFDPLLLGPNGCMDQDATWYGGRPRSTRGLRDSVLDGDPALPPLKGHSRPQFSASVHCGQMAGWTKMPLGMQIGLGPGDFVFDGDPALPR